MPHRPRGFINWKPRAKQRDLVEKVKAILHQYQEHGSMTVRQIFYRLVATQGYEKTEKSYNNLAEMLVKARRGRVMSFWKIRDDGDTHIGPSGFTSREGLIRGIKYSVENFTLRPSLGQPVYIIIMCEAAGMAPMVARMVEPYGCSVVSGGGFNAVSGKYRLADEIADRYRDEERRTIVLHIGDYDNSGVHIFSSLAEDVEGFLDDLLPGKDWGQFYRIALTEDQVMAFNLPTGIAKETDNRSFPGIDGDGTSTAQAEALDPDTLRMIVETSIHDVFWDQRIADEVKAQQEVDRAALKTWLDSFDA
jgi:hypothetical protein